MLKKILVGIVLLFLFLIFGASWHFSTQLLYPPISKCKTEHFVYCKGPSELSLQYDDVEFPSQDGLKLKGWFFPAKGAKKAVLLVHGHGASRFEGMRWVKPLVKSGFNVLTFDLRNSGKSEQSLTSMGFYEKKDVKGAIDYLIKTKKMKDVGVFGVSMGSVSSILATAEDNRIKAGVYEAVYANFGDLLAQIAKRDFGLPRYPLIPVVLWLFELRGDIDTDEINAEEKIASISPRPVFIIHCPKDNFIPFSHGERIFKAAKEPKQFWSAGCNVHAEAWQSNPKMAEQKVTSFFKKYIP